MGNMYKETVSRKKLLAVTMLFMLLVIALFITEMIKDIKFQGYNIGKIVTLFNQALVIFLLIFEILRCKIKYTYSLIADELIIYKISGSGVKVVENIKLRDIEFIGRSREAKWKKNIDSSRKYICSSFNLNPHCCIYKCGSKLRRFYFEPSIDLINKVEFNKKKRLIY